MDSPNLLLIVLALVLFLLVFLRPRAALRRTTGGMSFPESTRDSSALRDELDSLVAQLQDVSREQIARLDTKIQILQQLLSEADRKIAELTAAAEALREAQAAGSAAPAPTPPAPPANPLHQRIFAMADRGAPLGEIAATVGMPIGEVDLILGLRGRGGTPVGRGGAA